MKYECIPTTGFSLGEKAKSVYTALAHFFDEAVSAGRIPLSGSNIHPEFLAMEVVSQIGTGVRWYRFTFLVRIITKEYGSRAGKLFVFTSFDEGNDWVGFSSESEFGIDITPVQFFTNLFGDVVERPVPVDANLAK